MRSRFAPPAATPVPRRWMIGLTMTGLMLAGCSSSSDSTDATAAPAVSEAPAEPASTGAPAATEVPAATDAPEATDAPMVTDAPAPSEALASTDAPASTSPAAPATPLTIDELLAIGRPIVLAHAGGEDQHPHSTPFAFAESARAGVDMLDFDVQLTADGVLVVQHDETVDRTTEATGDVAAMTYDQLAALDNAYWFTAECVCRDQPAEDYVYRGVRTGDVPPPPGYSPDDFAIPRFADIVERFPGLPLNIEIKGTGAPAIAAAEELARILTDLDRLDHSVVTSFDDAVVEAFAGFAPTVELTPGLALSSAWVLERTPLPDGMRILQVPPVFGDIQVLSPEMIADSHDAGYVIWVWPNDRDLETADGYRTLLEQGMDGLNINFPALGVEAVTSFLAAAS